MKKLLIIFLLLTPTLFSFGQNVENHDDESEDFYKYGKRSKECDTRVQRLDSVLGYSYNSVTAEYTLINMVKYYYNSDLSLTSALGLSLPDRSNTFYQTYKRDQNGNLVEYLYQEWKNNEWTDIRLWQYIYDSNNNLTQEIHSAIDASGNWMPYERQFYYYSNGVVTSYMRQSKNQLGEWYDVAHHYYIYNSLGQLVNLYGEYITSKIVFWERTSFYNESGQLFERFLKVLRYDSVLKKNELKNSVHNTFSYDIYGDVSEVINDSWINNAWQLTSKAVYYYSLIPDKKVCICHNGHQICISANAVKSHLEHGDKLGPCDGTNNKKSHNGEGKEKEDSEETGNNSPKFTIFPNPTNSNVTISFKDDRNPFKNGYLLSSGGQKIYSFDIKGKSQIIVDMSGLLNGTYFIRMVSGDRIESMTVIKK